MKRIINTLLFMFATVTMMAQNSFVVADKNGNSQLVQSLIFQQQQNADRFTWKSDGTASGDIKDVFFIARAQAELATANSDEINQIMESVSEAGMADAEALAAALKENTSVEEAFTEDGNNVVTKLSGANHYLVYPTYKIESPFSELDLASDAAPAKARFMPKKSAGGRGQSVAIFNFFDGMEEYDVQNQIAMSIYDAFNDHHYDVQYYGPSQPDASRRFTYTHLYDVLQKSQDYAAIIIFSHGTTINGTGYLATEDEGIGLYQMPINGKNYQLVSTESMLTGDYKVDNNCILYLGVCDGVSSEGFKSSVKAPVIGYSGKTCMAEANAAIFFHLMLFEGYSREQAYNHMMPEPNNAKTAYHKTDKIDYLKIAFDDELRTQYIENCNVSFVKFDSYYADSDDWQHQAAGVISGGQIPMLVRVRLMPILERYYWDGYQTNVSKVSGLGAGNTFSSIVHIKGQPEGIYKYVVEGVLKDPKTGRPVYDQDGFKEWRRVKPESQRLVVYSKNYKSHGEEPTVPDEDTAAPVVLGSDGQPVDEITLSANSSQSFNIDGYSGHTLKALSFDEDVVTVSVSGTTLTVTGVSEGFALIGAYDVQNLLMDVIKVTVTAGVPSVNLCPDNHHPHMIDLGLPSGTKWACCNVGAEKPEDYGGYYGWGETEEKNSYFWYDYIYYDGSYFTDIGSDIAGTQYDVAHVKWGGSWVMPNIKLFNELYEYCSFQRVCHNGINGLLFTASNGVSLFLPAAGYKLNDDLRDVCDGGCYWSSSLFDVFDKQGRSEDSAVSWDFEDDSVGGYFFEGNGIGNFNYNAQFGGLAGFSKYCGLPVRPVVGKTPVVNTETITVKGVSFKMVGVEGGTFWMGSPDDDSEAYDDEKPRHKVTLSSFAIGQTEVTQELWEAVMGNNPSDYKGSSWPVVNVSWNDCQEFIRKLNMLTGRWFRLPTEAEWEYAARGGKNTKGYIYAGSNDIDAVAWHAGNSGLRLNEVARKYPNELDLYDMTGNVSEWCLDYSNTYFDYNYEMIDPFDCWDTRFRGIRGGGWNDFVENCRVTFRDHAVPDRDDSVLGFRLAH